MGLAVASMVRNEAKRYLPSALDAWGSFADEIVLLDDNSNDETRELAESRGICYFRWDGLPAWGNEVKPRKRLWQLATESRCDHILVLDADMVPAKNPKELIFNGVDGVAFTLFDLWQCDPPLYRSDGMWRGHEVPRLWLVRNPRDSSGSWSERGIHCGHFPYLKLDRVVRAPREYALLHYGYATPDDRKEKSLRYHAEGGQLTMSEWTHAASILDADPNLLPLDIEVTWPLRRES